MFKNIIKNINFLFVFFYLIILFIIVIDFFKVSIPYSFPDEFGYLSNAAFFAGLNWAEALGDSPYYTYGYSTILVPFFYLFDNGKHVFIMVQFINLIFLILSCFINYHIIQNIFKLEKSLHWVLVIPVLLFSVSFGNILHMPHSTPTMLNSFLFSLTILQLYKMLSLKKFIYLLNFFILISCMYFAHQRWIVLYIAIFLILIIFQSEIKIKKYQWAFLILVLLMSIFFNEFVKNYILDSVLIDSQNKLGNTYSSVYKKIIQFGFDGIKKFFLILAGQIYVLGISTFFVGYYFIFKTVKSFLNFLRGKKSTSLEILSVYIFTCYLGLVLLSAIFLAPLRDFYFHYIFYDRYTLSVLSIMFIIGFVQLYKDLMICSVKFLYVYSFFSIFLSFLCFFIISNFYSYTYILDSVHPFTSFSTLLFCKFSGKIEYGVIYYIIPVVKLAAILLIIYKKKIRNVILIIIMSFLFYSENFYTQKYVVKSGLFYTSIANVLNEHDVENIFYVTNDEFSNDLSYKKFKFLFYDKNISKVNHVDFLNEKVKEGDIIIDQFNVFKSSNVLNAKHKLKKIHFLGNNLVYKIIKMNVGKSKDSALYLDGVNPHYWMAKESKIKISTGSNGIVNVKCYYPWDIDNGMVMNVVLNGISYKSFSVIDKNIAFEIISEPNSIIEIELNNNFKAKKDIDGSFSYNCLLVNIEGL